jgi:hypothetical protein
MIVDRGRPVARLKAVTGDEGGGGAEGWRGSYGMGWGGRGEWGRIWSQLRLSHRTWLWVPRRWKL